MERKSKIKNKDSLKFYDQIIALHKTLDDAFLVNFHRSLPFNETLIDRWDRALKLGFGKNTSIYDSSLVLGQVNVGENCWIGPFTIIDGSGCLNIGDFCTISSGVHIYSHDNILQTLSSGRLPIDHKEVCIENNVYIGPNSVITKGVRIGSFSVIGAFSFVNQDIPKNSIVVGQPGRVIGEVIVKGEQVTYKYFK